MADPQNADFPNSIHSEVEATDFANQKLGATNPTHTEHHEQLDKEIVATQTKLGTGASPASSASTGDVLTKQANGTTTWSPPSAGTYQTDESFVVSDDSNVTSQVALETFDDLAVDGPGSFMARNGQELINWRVMVANRGTSPLNIWCLGDSYTAGYYASNRSKIWTNLFEQSLNEYLNISGNSVGYVSLGSNSYRFSDIWTVTGVVTNISGSYGPGLFAGIFDNGAYAETTQVCDRIYVLYPTGGSLSGTFSVYIDGELKVSGVSNNGATLNSSMWDSGQLVRGSHVVRVVGTGANTNNNTKGTVEGVYFFDGNYNGVRVINAGHSGYRTDQIFAGTTRTQYDGMRSDVLPPALVLIECMGNDIIFGIDVDTWRATLEDGIDEVRSKCAKPPPIALVAPHITDNPGWLIFRRAMYQVARKKGCVVIDWYQTLGNILSTDLAVPIDATEDDLHLNDLGNKAIAEVTSAVVIGGTNRVISRADKNGPVKKITGSYSVTHEDSTILADTTTINASVVLPDARNHVGNKTVVKNIGTSDGTLLVTGYNGQLIDGQASVTTTAQNDVWQFISDGTNNQIVNTGTDNGSFDYARDLTWSTFWNADDPDWSPPADGAALVNGTGLRDSSGNDHPLSTVVSGPLYRASVAALNGKPAIQFDGADDYLQTADYNPPDQPVSYFMVLVPDTQSSVRRLIDSRSVGSQNAITLSAADVVGLVNTSGSQDSSLTITEGQPTVIIAYLNGANSYVVVNGVQSSILSSVGASGNASGYTVAGPYNGSASQLFKGWISMAGTYPGELLASSKYEELNNALEEDFGAAIANVSTVVGPATSTDKAIVRWNGATGDRVQNSTATIDDNGSINIPTGQAYKINGTSLAKGDVGLGNVDNTSDTTKNSASATLTNKTIALGSNTVSGTTAQFNAALSDNDFATLAGSETLTNKRHTRRVTSITSSATPTINTDNCDAVTITALATNITSMTSGLSGAPTNFDTLMIRIKDDGTARTISWGSSFEAKGTSLPTTTVLSKVLTLAFIYDTVTSKWGCVASAQEA